jgi:hypothetical protein
MLSLAAGISALRRAAATTSCGRRLAEVGVVWHHRWYHTNVTTKTTVYLPDELKARIEREARRRGIAEAEVIRTAIESGLSRPAPRGGLFAADPFADRVDELLPGFGEQ